MDAELLKTLGQIAGLGGIALGVFLFLFREIIRKSIFPTLKKDDAYRLLRLIAILIWTVALVGLGAWTWIETRPENTAASGTKVEAREGVAAGRDINVQGDIHI